VSRIVRLRVARLTLALHAPRATPGLALADAFGPFLATRGGDIRLELREAPPPAPDPSARLFDSGGVWRVYRRPGGLLYTFETPRLDPPLYKAVAIDAALTRGTLYFPPQRRRRAPGHPLAYPLDELLFQHRLAREAGLEVHACGLVVGGRLLLFCGQSGAGKSTTARLWRRLRPDVPILSDDRLALRFERGHWRGYGTPWHGDGGFASPAAARLGAVFFLRQAARSRATRLSTPACAARLFARSFPPLWDARGLHRVLGACARVAGRVPGYELEFRPDESAIDAVLAALPR
jgi:hypothetical protein